MNTCEVWGLVFAVAIFVIIALVIGAVLYALV